MKKKLVKNVVIQSFVFNFILFTIFSVVLLNTVMPKYLEIEKLKTDLSNKQEEYTKLLSKGIDFKKFKSLNLTLGKGRIDKDIQLKNILKEFSENDYEKNFLITSVKKEIIKKEKIKDYKTFLDFKESDVTNKKLAFDEKGANGEIEKILPYYTEDSSVDEDSLTDFKFINHFEVLLDKFNLTYDGIIGVSDLELANGYNYGNKGNADLINSKIYYFPLSLNFKGTKKDIIDFLFYIENVGKINYEKGNVYAVKNIGDLNIGNSIFNNLGDNFYPDKNYLNNLFFEINTFSMKDYIDSSEEVTPKTEDLISKDIFWKYIIDDQGTEKISIKLDLKFYVKGMPTFRMKGAIKKIISLYQKLVIVGNAGNSYIKVNRNKLQNSKEIKAMRNFKKYTGYLLGIKKDIDILNKEQKRIKSIGKAFKKSKKYQKIFFNIKKNFEVDSKILSEKKVYNVFLKQINIENNKK